jgi:surfeit locus 1 family protein
LNENQFLQDNQFYQHQVGYFVLTPFVTDSQKVILVNRGWVPKDLHKDKLILGAEPQTLKGRVSAAPTRTFHLGENLRGAAAWPRVIQVIKIDELSSVLGKTLDPVILLLNPEEPRGFARDWQPQGLSPEKHRGYALQWFAFAALLAVLFLVLNIKKT